MADENYAIRVSFDGIDKAIGDIKLLQSAIGNIKAPVLNLSGAESAKIAEASLKKLQLEVDALEAKKAQSAANDLNRANQVAAKQEANGAKLLAQLERQDAVAQRRLTQGNVNGNNTEDKIAVRNAKIYEEQIRLKQQLNAIQNTAFSDADRARAEAFANSINKVNVEKINKEFAATNVGTRTFIGNMQDASAQLQVLAGKLNEIKGSAQAAFLELDTARKKLSTISDDANGLVKALANVAKENSNQATTAQLAGAAYEVQSAGFSKTADTVKILDASLKGSVGGFSDVTTVSKAAISVLNAYGLGADQAAATVDKFTAVQQSGLITVDQYASQISRVAPVAAAAGVSLDQLNGFIATATASGVPVESTFAGLRQALASTIKPSADAAKEAERLGIKFDATALRTKGLNGILADVKNSGKATGDSFSKLFGSIEAVAAIQPAINNLGKLEANIRASGESAGLTQANFDKAKSTLVGFANEAQNALATLGEKINQTAIFNPLIGGARLLVTAFQSIPEPAQSLIAIIVGLGASFVGISAVITGLLAVTQPTIAAFASLKLAFAANTAVTGTYATVTGFAATANAFLAKEVTLAGIATAASSAKTVAATAITQTWTAAVALGSTQVTLLGVKTAAAAVIANASFAGFATAVAGVLSPLGLVALAVGSLVAAAKPLADAFNVSNSTKSVNELKDKLKELDAARGKIDTAPIVDDNSLGKQGGFVNPFNSRLSEQKEVIKFAEAQKEYDQIIGRSNQLLTEYGLNTLDAGDKARLGEKGIEEFTKKVAEQKENIDATIDSLKAQSAQAGDNPVLKKQLNNEIASFAQRKKLLDDRVAFLKESATKEVAAIAEVTDAQRKQAIALKETQNQDAEKSIKRSFDDGKAKRDRENADVIKAIEEKNALAKGELDRRQALETEALKEKQTLALQDKQRAFDDTQNAKKLQLEDALDAKKRANEEKLNALKQQFDDKQNALKEQRAEKQRKNDEAFAAQRAQRDKQASEALSGAKQLISNEGAIATAKPEDRAKIAAQIKEEDRIRAQAATQGQGGVQSQEQLVAQAKQLAQVSAIATGEEQKKVEFAIAELDKANKAKQLEIDKAEQAKRTEEKRASDKAFEAEQNAAKLAFDAEQNTAKLNFENTVLKPEKQKIEAELQASKLAFERGELAALKTQQAADERALKLQQTNEDLAAKKAADAELETIKLAQKEKELALDRAFEDQKIERERAFKEQQRALDKASAIEIQQILGKSAQQIINALAVTKGGTALSAATGVGAAKVPAFARGVTNFVGGAALVGEKGAELVTLPRGSNVLPANQTKQVLNNNSGGNKTYNVNVTTGGGDPTAIALQIQREMARSAALSM
jgi:hypothetical protein